MLSDFELLALIAYSYLELRLKISKQAQLQFLWLLYSNFMSIVILAKQIFLELQIDFIKILSKSNNIINWRYFISYWYLIRRLKMTISHLKDAYHISFCVTDNKQKFYISFKFEMVYCFHQDAPCPLLKQKHENIR